MVCGDHIHAPDIRADIRKRAPPGSFYSFKNWQLQLINIVRNYFGSFAQKPASTAAIATMYDGKITNGTTEAAVNLIQLGED